MTILVKGLQEDLLKELKRLKVELGCKMWAELLSKLAASREFIIIDEEGLDRIRAGVQGFLNLRDVDSKK